MPPLRPQPSETYGDRQTADDERSDGCYEHGGGGAVLGPLDGYVAFRMQPVRQVLESGVHEFESEHHARGHDTQGEPDERRSDERKHHGCGQTEDQLCAKAGFATDGVPNTEYRKGKPPPKYLIFHRSIHRYSQPAPYSNLCRAKVQSVSHRHSWYVSAIVAMAQSRGGRAGPPGLRDWREARNAAADAEIGYPIAQRPLIFRPRPRLGKPAC